ncbi:MAG: transglutaminase-like domain-containing protein [Polaromonas sp.]
MVRLELSTQLSYEIFDAPCSFIFNIEAAHTARQTVLKESLELPPGVIADRYTDPVTHSRFLRLSAPPGLFTLHYSATLDLDFWQGEPASLVEVSPLHVPGDVLPYLVPSRYCESDRLMSMAYAEFGHLPPGHSRVQAICAWVGQHVKFQSNSSHSGTSALDTVVDRTGVCRDFAHLMVALCRALSIPARMASGMDYGADPALGPLDFHAYVEVYLAEAGEGAATGAGRWVLFDPAHTAIPMALVRLGTGRDAADIAFATLYGQVNAHQPVLSMQPVPNGRGVLVEPQHTALALSTDGV